MGAFVPRGQYLWTFKAVGPADQIAAHESRFLEFLKTVKFEKDDTLPAWELPEGWEKKDEDPEKRMGRYATIKLADSPKVDFAVSRAESPDDKVTKPFLVSNFSRWRDQLGSEPVMPRDYDSYVDQRKMGDNDVHLISIYGVYTTPRSMAMPEAEGAGPRPPPADRPPASQTPEGSPAIKHEVPEGWKGIATSAFRKLAYEVVDGESRVECTVIPLGPAPGSGTLLQNVNRWRAQVGLPDIDDATLEKSTLKYQVGKDEGVLVQAIDPGEGGKGVIGAIVDKGEQVWFIKMSGPSPLVTREKDNFLKFAGSLELP